MKPLTICDTPLHTFKKALIDLKQKKDNWSLSHLRIQEREGKKIPLSNLPRFLEMYLVYTSKSFIPVNRYTFYKLPFIKSMQNRGKKITFIT